MYEAKPTKHQAKAMSEYVSPTGYSFFLLCLAVVVLLAGSPITFVNAQSPADPTVRDQVYLVVFEPGPASANSICASTAGF
ncbi:MAG TPA: hypothetical protein VKP65_12250 [Rhodothermales bacterium]|nr:hypothetical protein [Rhodothermales bacterium]